MKKPIRPNTLKALRELRGWSQAKLEMHSEEMRNKVGLATIKRIETWRATETYMANPTVAERLAKTLGVDIEDLGKEPKIDDVGRARTLRRVGMRQLRTVVHEDTSLGFRMVEHLYGIPVRTQVEMAPLCMALLAEGSLAWRKQRLAEIDEKMELLMSLGKGHLSFAQTVCRTEEASYQEEASISSRDVFGKNVAEDSYDLGYDPGINNPLADYLREFAQNLGTTDIKLDPEVFEIGRSGFPDYRIGASLLEELAAGDIDAEYALACGHARIPEIPAFLNGPENTERRVEWLISQIPEDEIADRKAQREELLSLLGGLQFPGAMETATEERENDDA